MTVDVGQRREKTQWKSLPFNPSLGLAERALLFAELDAPREQEYSKGKPCDRNRTTLLAENYSTRW